MIVKSFSLNSMTFCIRKAFYAAELTDDHVGAVWAWRHQIIAR